MRLTQLSRHLVAVFCCLLSLAASRADDIIPPLAKIKPDHPRLLLCAKSTPLAISLAQLQSLKRDAEFDTMLRQLKSQDHAAAQALVWLLTQDASAADKAIKRMRAYRYPGNVDTFHTFFRLTEFALAYDWLYNYPGFSKQIKSEVRVNVAPLTKQGLRATNDHMFHNYIWMSAGGVSLWALATAGEDAASDELFEQIRNRFNNGLYPAWRYLDGAPSEPMGYWALYVFTPGVFTLLASQSAFDTDLVSKVRTDEGDWLNRNFESLIHSTLPDMRYIPWGDLQSGPNGGVTFEMAGAIDALTWGLRCPHGKQFSDWLAKRRGLARFHGETAIFYFLYSRQLASTPIQPATSPLSFLAGNRQSAHFIARSSWDDDATIVAFTCTDHFGDHHHYDQGSFIIYRHGLLAIDPPVYRQVRGPQQKTEHHNTLLIGGKPQRPVRGQWFITVQDFQKNLHAGRKLETGDILFWHDAGDWAAVAGQFAQAYDCAELQSCIRQLLFIRPDKVVIVDRLVATPGKQVPDVQWLLQLPAQPRDENGTFVSTNGKSWIRCRDISPAGAKASIEPTPVNTQRLSLTYPGRSEMVLVHALQVGDGPSSSAMPDVKTRPTATGLDLTIDGKVFTFAFDSEARISAR